MKTGQEDMTNRSYNNVAKFCCNYPNMLKYSAGLPPVSVHEWS